MQPLRIIFTALAISLAFTIGFASAQTSLNGVAIHSELGKEQFAAALFTQTKSTDSRRVILSDEDKRMEVRILPKRLSSRRFKRMWIEGMAINASSSELKEHAQHMADFSNMMKIKLTAGDIFAVHRKGGVVEITINGTKLGVITDPRFFDLLLRTWVGPVPLSSKFRDDIMAGGEIDSDNLTTFNSTKPTQERIDAVQVAISQIKPVTSAAQQKSSVVVDVPKPKIDTKITIAAPVIEKPTITTKLPSAPSTPPSTASTSPAKAQPPSEPVQEPKPDANDAKASLADAPIVEEPTPAPPKPVDNTPEPTDTLALLDNEEDLEEDLPFTAESLLSQTLYIAKLKRWSHQYLKYPSRAASRGQEGNVRMNVTIDRSGRVQNIEILEAAEFKLLTREATRAVKRADPFPPIPEEVTGETFVFTLPVVFKLQEEG